MIVFFGLVTLCFFLNQDETMKPKSVNGVLDLRHFNFQENEPVKLDGEWEFIPGKLISSEDFEKNDPKLF